MKWNQRLYLGTWQLSGDFQSLSLEVKEEVLMTALSLGVVRFDTAAAYGQGSVESLLGRMLPHDAFVVTKVPAIRTLEGKLTPSIAKHYPVGQVRASLEGSLMRLSRSRVDVVLLHNWHEAWSEDVRSVVDTLLSMKDSGLAEKIGISLPDGFRGDIGTEILSLIDVIEAPYNQRDVWIVRLLPVLRKFGIEVLIRSLFMQGMRLKSEGETRLLSVNDARLKRDYPSVEISAHSAQKILTDVWSLGTGVVVGATTPEQIIANVNCLKGDHHELTKSV